MKTRISQCRAILGHMRLHGSITPREAIRKYNCFRLGARIYELKKKGHSIKSEKQIEDGKTFSKYSLNKG